MGRRTKEAAGLDEAEMKILVAGDQMRRGDRQVPCHLVLSCRLGPWSCVSLATAILISGYRGGACAERGALIRYVAVLSVPPPASGLRPPQSGHP